MTLYTNQAGKTSTTQDPANYPYGPYLTTAIPDNSINTLATTKGLANVARFSMTDIDDSTGWIFSIVTGELRANSTGYLSY